MAQTDPRNKVGTQGLVALRWDTEQAYVTYAVVYGIVSHRTACVVVVVVARQTLAR